MKWKELDVTANMDNGKAKLTLENDELILISACERCDRKRIDRFSLGIADEVLDRLQWFQIPGAHSAVEINKTEIINWICEQCHSQVTGQLEFRLGDDLINDAKAMRYKDSFEGNYLGVVNIQSEIHGGRFPVESYGCFISPKEALNGLCYWCGSCGNKGWNYQVSREWMALVDRIEETFQDNGKDLQPVKINHVFYCQRCGAKINIKAVLNPVIPQNRAELLSVYEKWRKVHPI